MSDEHRKTWQAYLAYLRARAQRLALRRARLADPDSPAQRPGARDGQGAVQIEYTTYTDQPPWSPEALRRYEALADGGDWEDNDTPDGVT